ncbi:hypothetical protein FSST1_009710 [Fusarium sambucinum]
MKPSGCWTCKLRHRKCDLHVPACRECKDRCIPCHGYGPKPVWMDGSAAEKQELTRIKKDIKLNVRNARRARKSGRQREKDTTPTARQSPLQPSPVQDATSHLSPLQPGDVADHVHLDLQTQPTAQGETSPQVSLCPETSAPSYILQPKSASLIMYYLDHVFCWQFPYFRIRSRLGDRGWLLLFLSNGGSLSCAALALAARHRNAIQVPQQQGYHYNQEAFEYYSRALRELCEFSRRTEIETLLSDKPKLAEFLAASMTLISFQVFNGAEYDWLPHLDAVMTVLGMISPKALRKSSSSNNPSVSPVSINSGEESHPDFSFLITQALWFDILACVSTGRVPRIAYQQWLEESDLEMADLMGCYNWVMVAIGDLAHLQAWKEDMQDKRTLSVPELVIKCQNIETRLQNGIVELEVAQNADTETPHATWVSHIFALAALVLSSTIVSGPWASLPEIKETVAKAVDLLRDWPRAITLQGLVWPLYIIGCMAETEQQGFFESLLTNLIRECGGIGNSGTVLKIMKNCWAMQHRDQDGAGLSFQMGSRVLLI